MGKRLTYLLVVLVAVPALGVLSVQASTLTLSTKQELLAAKRAEFDRLLKVYQAYGPLQAGEASLVGHQAKDLAPAIGRLEAEVEGVTDAVLESRFRSAEAALRDGIAKAEYKGASVTYVSVLKGRLEDLVQLEHAFSRHDRPNDAITLELDRLFISWN